MKTTAMIMIIIGCANIFGWILTYYRIPAIAANQLINLSQNPLVIGLLLVLLYLLLGCIMESAAIVVMTVPVILPILNQLGIDPVAFGVIVAMCMSLGTLTPPLGIVMYILCDIAHISVDSYIKVIWPYLTALIFVIIVLVLFPQLIMLLPNYFLN